MTETTEDITYEKLETFLQEMASATVKPIPMDKTREMALRRDIDNAKKEIQHYRELISAAKSKILTWQLELERLKRTY